MVSIASTTAIPVGVGAAQAAGATVRVIPGRAAEGRRREAASQPTFVDSIPDWSCGVEANGNPGC